MKIKVIWDGDVDRVVSMQKDRQKLFGDSRELKAYGIAIGTIFIGVMIWRKK